VNTKKIIKMVEVFSTDVCEKPIADLLVIQIEQKFRNYRANFDLEDCDHILRIKSPEGTVNAESIINFVGGFGYRIEVLPDTVIPKSYLLRSYEDSSADFGLSSTIANDL
jgi:hypothetical protein